MPALCGHWAVPLLASGLSGLPQISLKRVPSANVKMLYVKLMLIMYVINTITTDTLTICQQRPDWQTICSIVSYAGAVKSKS